MAFKAIFSIVGLFLFASEISYKFYWSANMPVVPSSVQRHTRSNYRPVSATNGSARLSLDKRFDLKPAFALLTPVFRFLCFVGPDPEFPRLIVLKPVNKDPDLLFLRGPPSPYISFS